jgi:hypothetical protein
MVKNVKFFVLGLLCFQVINLSGNIIRLVPEWQLFIDYFFYFLLLIASLGSVGCYVYAQQTKDYFKSFLFGVFFWFQAVFFMFAYKLAWLDVVLNNVAS